MFSVMLLLMLSALERGVSWTGEAGAVLISVSPPSVSVSEKSESSEAMSLLSFSSPWKAPSFAWFIARTASSCDEVGITATFAIL
jgi:hypothetical protein